MSVDLAEVFDVGTGGFEDAQPEETEHDNQREVVDVVGVACGAEQCFELKM